MALLVGMECDDVIKYFRMARASGPDGSTARSVDEPEETPVSRWAKGYVPLPDAQRRKLHS